MFVGTECAGKFGRYAYGLPVHEPLARAILEGGIEQGFARLHLRDWGLTFKCTLNSVGVALRSGSRTPPRSEPGNPGKTTAV